MMLYLDAESNLLPAKRIRLEGKEDSPFWPAMNGTGQEAGCDVGVPEQRLSTCAFNWFVLQSWSHGAFYL